MAGTPNISGGFSDFGSAISDFYAAEGDKASAKSYLQAADFANQNAQLEKMSTAIQESATQRQIFKVVGQQRAQVAGAGLAESGSAIDIMKDSTRQGALQKALVNIQGTINSNAYTAQAGAYMGEYNAAEAAAKGAEAAGAANTVAGVFSIFGL